MEKVQKDWNKWDVQFYIGVLGLDVWQDPSTKKWQKRNKSQQQKLTLIGTLKDICNDYDGILALRYGNTNRNMHDLRAFS